MDSFEQFRQSQFITELPEKVQRQLFDAACRRSFFRGGTVWTEGSECHEVVVASRGWFKLVRGTGVGREVIVELREAGSMMCSSVLFAGARYHCSSIAMEDEAEVMSIPMAAFVDILEHVPGAAMAFVRHLAARQIATCERLTQLSNGTVPQRLAALLSELAARAGVVNAHGFIRVPIPLTRSDLAQLCATTTESVIRQMSDLERRGVVQTATRGFVITDMARLKAQAAGEQPGTTQEMRVASAG